MAKDLKLTEFDKFSVLCSKYDTSPQAARIVICKGRKVGFVLSVGIISSPGCFLNERPTKSSKESEAVDVTLIPHGWKIALEVKRAIYVGETSVRGGTQPPLYRFSRIAMDTGEVEAVSEFKEHPTPAFTEVASRSPAFSATSGDTERPNGKLYMGIQYTEAQQLLRRASSTLVVLPEASERFAGWMDLKPSSVQDSPLFAGRRKTLVPPSSSSSARKRMPLAPPNLTSLGIIAQRAIDGKEGIRSELDSFRDRPAKIQREGSLREAMRMLRDNSLELSPEDLDFDSLGLKSAGKMSAEALFHAFKNPGENHLTLTQMKRAVETLLQMAVPLRLVQETFEACDRERTGRVTLQNFVRVIQQRDEELWRQFRSIDYDGDMEITMNELIRAKASGVFSAQERELDAVLDAMDRVSKREGNHAQVDQKIQWHEFRAMMILLPPASTIQAIVNVVKAHLDERDLIRHVQSSALSLDSSVMPSPPPTLHQAKKDSSRWMDSLFNQQDSPSRVMGGKHPLFVDSPNRVRPTVASKQKSFDFDAFMGGEVFFELQPPPVESRRSSGLKPTFERSSSFQQYAVMRTQSPAATSSSQVAMAPGPAVHPFREIFGHDEEFESIFETPDDLREFS